MLRVWRGSRSQHTRAVNQVPDVFSGIKVLKNGLPPGRHRAISGSVAFTPSALTVLSILKCLCLLQLHFRSNPLPASWKDREPVTL
jgi:hypothetical protein